MAAISNPHYHDELLNRAFSNSWIDKVYTVMKANVIKHPVATDEVFPVEFTLVSFSLARGVIETYTTLVEPVLPPCMGYAARALYEETGLPIPLDHKERFPDSARDFPAVASNVRRFIYRYLGAHSRLTKKMVFTMSTEMKVVLNTLKWLGEHSGDHTLKLFLTELEVLDLSKFFRRMAQQVRGKNHLYKSPLIQFQLSSLAEKQLNKMSRYEYWPEITCEYHNKHASEQMNMCSKNWVLCRVFEILDEFIEPLEIPKENGHDVKKFNRSNYRPAPITISRSENPFISSNLVN